MKLPLNSSDDTGALDGSAGNIKRLLEDLASLMGQVGEASPNPVVEFQFGDIITRTSLCNVDDVVFLSTLVLLPGSQQMDYALVARQQKSFPDFCDGEVEVLWNSDDGQYVAVRRFPISNFHDERDVMDAILNTANQTAAWFHSVGASEDSSQKIDF